MRDEPDPDGDHPAEAIGRDPAVLREIAVTIAATVFCVAAAVWLFPKQGLPDRSEEPSVAEDREASAPDATHELPLVSYRGPIGVVGVGDHTTPVRISEVDVVGTVRADADQRFELRKLFRARRHRLAEDVDAVLRAADRDAIEDPEAIWIREALAARFRETLGAGVIEDVALSHYRVFDVPAVRR